TTAFSRDEAASTAAWVRRGGVLVYASERGDPELDAALGVGRIPAVVPADTVHATGPLVEGVSQVKGSAFAAPLSTSSVQVAVLRAGTFVIAYLQRSGSGTLVVLADPLELANGLLDKADNGRFAAGLLGLVTAGAPVEFDEFHHGLSASDFTPQA